MAFEYTTEPRSRDATAAPGRPERGGDWEGQFGAPHLMAFEYTTEPRSRDATAAPGRPERGGDWGAISGPPI
jgi:hypothetical protein